MLDDLPALRDVVRDYRTAASAAGLTWPAADAPSGGPPPADLVRRLFDVDHVAEQVTWLHSQGWGTGRLLPGGGELISWPADGEALNQLSLSIGVPFPWRRQLPLFHFDIIIYTFVLAGEHEGEIWRYEISPDAFDAVRAATSLATLFTTWTKGIEAGVIGYNEFTGWLSVSDGTRSGLRLLEERAPNLDPLAFPASMALYPLLRARQTECGVDMSHIDRGFECMEELLDEIEAIRTSLGV
ncbi:hypothetical protein G6045_04025 [Streptomyces sp. YC504]|uniref:Uncharacterized protein n=1 Tax=Streptomyces mesophilus TaxID=1775132 RepID=A0A6G4XBC5_9ACTN|nr:hypothetical protein [Streptomyces mesophilus]NGO74856.1 hypothetical protein [Streptomyces mesophilus]